MAHDPVVMLVATDSFIAAYDGIEYTYKQDETRMRSDDPRIQNIRHLFKPLDASFLDVEAASAAPGERRGQ